MKGLATSGISVSVANVATMPMGKQTPCIYLSQPGYLRASAVNDPDILYLQMSLKSGCNCKPSGWQMALNHLDW